MRTADGRGFTRIGGLKRWREEEEEMRTADGRGFTQIKRDEEVEGGE